MTVRCPAHACTVHAINAPRTHHVHATGDIFYTYAEFVEYYGDEAAAAWARAGRGVDAARNTPKKPKLMAAGASGAASGGSARAGAARDVRDSGGGGGGGSDVEKWEGKLMKHLGQVKRYLEKLQGEDATRAQD